MQFAKTTLKLMLPAVLLAALAGCSHESSPTGAAIPKPKGSELPVPVIAAKATQENVPVTLTAIGNARAFASVAIKARVDGQLTHVAFKQGDEVKQGELIFQLDPRPLQAALDQAQAVQARDEAALQNAEANRRRTDELADTKAVTAAQVDANRATVAALRATVAADKASVESAKLQLSFCSITSPVNGRIGLLQVDAGNMVKNNDTMLATVNQTRPIYVDFSVPEQSLLAVRQAAAGGPLGVKATAPHQPGPAVTGELEVVDNQVDATTGTVLLRARFANADEHLWPGQFVNVTLDVGQLTNAVVVPTQAVQVSQEGEFVFVIKSDATVEKRLVKQGMARDGVSVIEAGLKAGETVVTDGQLKLVPGGKVEVKTPANGAETTNIQHRTSNLQSLHSPRPARPLDVGCWMLVVGCSTDFNGSPS
jgi:membrane fusion protein, multidrug efflux system